MDATTAARRPRLRTKTGCLTCRQRRKKCDEKFPVCTGCSATRQTCQWPSGEDLVDRRFSAHRKSRHGDALTTAAATPSGTASSTSSPSYPPPPSSLPSPSPSFPSPPPPPPPPPSPPPSSSALQPQQRLRRQQQQQQRHQTPRSDCQMLQPLPRSSQARSVKATAAAAVPSRSQCHYAEAGLSHSSLRRGLEPVVSIHFSQSFYNLILLPGSHPSFRDNWLSDILSSMTRSRSLYFSVLACAASHLHFTDARPQMQELAIRYYSDAVRSLSRQLASGPSTSLVPDGQDDVDVLMPVMFLYLHGFLGLGTYRDIPRHVDAAMRILSARFLDTGATLERTVDKLAVESVLYQVFIVATGIWSERAPRLDQNSNGYVDFWIRAERLLQASSFFPDESILDSPVLGVPVQLLRLVMSICRGIHRPDTIDAAAMRDLRAQVDWWCDAMGLGTTTTTTTAAAAAAATPATASGPDTSATSSVSPSPASPSPSCSSSSSSSSSSGCSSCSSSTTSDPALINRDSSHLYALVSSLLLDRLESGDTKLCRPVDPNGKDLPQAARAMRIVHAHSADEAWTSSYIGGWPLYTLGFLVDDPRSVEAIVEDMRNRWTRTRFFIIARYIHDMEVARGLGHTGAIPPEAHRWLAL